MTLSKDELVTRFAALVTEYGHDWTTIASKLNGEKITTPKGKAWNNESARAFHRVNFGSAPNGLKGSSPEIAKELPTWMNHKALEDLKDMIEWWRSRKGETFTATGRGRLVFKGTRRNSGVHVNDEILKRAMEKAKEDKTRSGGSLSLLVEWLLWEYIGCPEDLLEHGSTEPNE